MFSSPSFAAPGRGRGRPGGRDRPTGRCARWTRTQPSRVGPRMPSGARIGRTRGAATPPRAGSPHPYGGPPGHPPHPDIGHTAQDHFRGPKNRPTILRKRQTGSSGANSTPHSAQCRPFAAALRVFTRRCVSRSSSVTPVSALPRFAWIMRSGGRCRNARLAACNWRAPIWRCGERGWLIRGFGWNAHP
jgi:hypothetical protein